MSANEFVSRTSVACCHLAILGKKRNAETERTYSAKRVPPPPPCLRRSAAALASIALRYLFAAGLYGGVLLSIVGLYPSGGDTRSGDRGKDHRNTPRNFFKLGISSN